MALVDKIERYGRSVEAGILTRTEAAQKLANDSGGGLTETGAATAIDEWKTVRSSYEQEFKRAGVLWARSHGIDV